MVLNCFLASSVLVVVKSSFPNLSLSILISSYHFVATIFIGTAILCLGYSVRTKLLYLHFIRSLLGVTAYFLYFHALSITSIANVIALGYTDGILTCFFSYIFLKEHINRTQIANLVLSFIGALMIIKPDNHIINTGALLAGISAILWAASNILIKVIGKKDKAYVQLFYSNFFTFLLAGIVTIYQNHTIDLKFCFEYYHWILLLAIMSSIQYFALFKSLNLTKSGIVMPFFIISVVFIHIYGYTLLNETQDTTEILGTILVLLVGVLQIFRVITKTK